VDFRDYDTRLAAYALVVDDRDRVLLALWNEGPEPEWTMPGGGVEYDETPAEGAVRELLEETGYDVELGPLLGIDIHVVPAEDRLDPPGRPMKSVRVVYRARIVGGELRHEVDGTTDEARWIPLADVPALPRVPLVDAALAMAASVGAG
jgi:8-oxo-dGTP diphosphatase